MTNQQEQIEQATAALVEALRPLPTLDKESEDYSCTEDIRDCAARDAVREVLYQLKVYGACGCQLCLS